MKPWILIVLSLFSLMAPAKEQGITAAELFLPIPPEAASLFLTQLAVFDGRLVEQNESARRFTARFSIINNRGENLGDCSGVLIHARVILTAAHCLVGTLHPCSLWD